jgi:chemotaxis protein CheY-P-specific phosphatase CheC
MVRKISFKESSMFDRIVEASNNYFQQMFEQIPVSIEQFESRDFFVSKIDAKSSENEKEIYIFLDQSLINELYNFMLGEDPSCEEEAQDFSCEVANLIVGSAKVLAQDDKESFSISTPVFVAHANDIISDNYEKSSNFSVLQKPFSIRARYV